jgi:hypothetical protein
MMMMVVVTLSLPLNNTLLKYKEGMDWFFHAYLTSATDGCDWSLVVSSYFAAP